MSSSNEMGSSTEHGDNEGGENKKVYIGNRYLCGGGAFT